jgi:hypothetical protein
MRVTQILGRIFGPDYSRSGLDNPPPPVKRLRTRRIKLCVTQILGQIFGPDYSRSGPDNPPPLVKRLRTRRSSAARHPDSWPDILTGLFQKWAKISGRRIFRCKSGPDNPAPGGCNGYISGRGINTPSSLPPQAARPHQEQDTIWSQPHCKISTFNHPKS